MKYTTQVISCIFALTVLISITEKCIAANDPSLIAHFPMELSGNLITDVITGQSFVVQNNFGRPENVAGAEGNALRLDGYSTFSTTQFNVQNLSTTGLTVSIWCALETYPVISPDNLSYTATYIAGNMRDDLKTGFAFTLNNTGKYAFEIYINGVKTTCYDAYENLPKYEWANLTATVNTTTREVKLFRNAQLVAKVSFAGNSINTGNNVFMIGKSFSDDKVGIFRNNIINGLVDDIRIFSKTFADNEITEQSTQNPADLTIPKSRHERDIQRPVFHGLPATNWTNEPHGLVYYNNKYHIFFQKNANGPYMARLHWGHLSSSDLLNWTEEKIAIGPGASYDIKGTWSGCLFKDDVYTGGIPNIFYTGVDYAKASINKAVPIPSDDKLIDWIKDNSNPLIPNKPVGLSDDFRDPYIFKFNGELYMIVGTSKNGLGATTLHKYNSSTQKWSNDGTIFYQAAGSNFGTFWEMPVIVPMANNKWLFLVTPLGSLNGVETLYWVGTINSNGTFNPYSSTPKEVELGTMGKQGYGLLSPSVMQKDGKTIAIGIVPDKLPSQTNLNMGWAHLYSLPREWSLDLNNNLIQIPFSETSNMRVPTMAFNSVDTDINGTLSLAPASGKAVELEGNFTISTATRFGFNVRKNGNNAIQIYYTPSANKITVNTTNISKLSNDAGVFNGIYESVIPQTLPLGSNLKLHIFIDHSIMDIFINNMYAFSLRVFPTDTNAEALEVFSDGGATHINSVKAWRLNPRQGITDTNSPDFRNKIKIYSTGDSIVYENVPLHSRINIYNLDGQKIISINSDQNSGLIPLKKNQTYLIEIINDDLKYSTKILM